MQIYFPDNELLLDTPVDDSSYRFKEIMGENSLTLKLSVGSALDMAIGSWCEFKGEQYILFSPGTLVKQHSEHYDYSFILRTWMAYMKFVKFKFFTVERNDGEPDRMVGAPKLKFSLTATPEDFARLLVDNMNFSGEDGWEVGECIYSDPVTIDFNHDYCYGVLQKIADAFEIEWEVENKTIHIRKVERKDADGNRIAFPLSYGYNNGILPGIQRTQFDDSKVINRVWVQGGDRNINYGTYGNDTLLMPKSTGFEYEGKQYRTDETGCFVEESGRTGRVSDDSLDTSKIYPKRVGTVSAVIVVDDAKGFYDFVDETIPDELDFSEMIIPGSTMTVIFQTGQLAGKELEASYDHAERLFKLVPQNDNGLIYPQGTIIPVAGDRYAVFHIELPQTYISDAENEAATEAIKYLHDNSQPRFTYKWTLDGIYAKREWETIGDYLSPGYFVRFSDPQFLPEPTDIRITSVKEFVNKPKSPVIELSNHVTGKPLGSVLAQIPAQEQRTDNKVKYLDNRLFSSLNEYKYLKTALAGDTTIDGGLILTSLIQLLNGDVQVRSGINGVDEFGGDSVFLWAGGTLAQAIEFVSQKKGESNYGDTGNIRFVVTFDGKQYARDTYLSGKFESNIEGNKVVIDPSSTSSKIKLLNKDNTEVGSFGFFVDGSTTQGRFNLYRLFDGDPVSVASISPVGLQILSFNGSGLVVNLDLETDNLTVRLIGLPTSATGLRSGDLYRNGNQLMIAT